MPETDHLIALQKNTISNSGGEFFKTYSPTSVCMATSTGLVAAVMPTPATVAAVRRRHPTGSGDEEATLSRSTSSPSASTSTDGEPPITTKDNCSTDEGIPADFPFSTDYTMERVTGKIDSEALSSHSMTFDDPATALSTSYDNAALTAPPPPDRRLNGLNTQGQTTVVTKQQPTMK